MPNKALSNYSYGNESAQFIFFKMPASLSDPHFKWLPADAKLLYSMLLDRMDLSAKKTAGATTLGETTSTTP